jgi:hypothetical protein
MARHGAWNHGMHMAALLVQPPHPQHPAPNHHIGQPSTSGSYCQYTTAFYIQRARFFWLLVRVREQHEMQHATWATGPCSPIALFATPCSSSNSDDETLSPMCKRIRDSGIVLLVIVILVSHHQLQNEIASELRGLGFSNRYHLDYLYLNIKYDIRFALEGALQGPSRPPIAS